MLVVLTVISLVASTVAVWARATVLDTDRFVEVVGPALTDPAFAAALSDVVADEVLVALDLEVRVAASLEAFDELVADAVIESVVAPGITAALEDRVVEVVDSFVTSNAVVERLPGLVRQVHAGGVALVRGDLAQLPNVEVRDGEVRLDLVPVIAQALQVVVVELRSSFPDVTVPPIADGPVGAGREQLAEALQTRLPADFGQLTVVTRADLTQLQGAVRTADRLVGALLLLTAVLIVATIATAGRWRRRSVVQLAAGLTLGMGIAALLVGRIEQAVLDAITDPEADRAAGALLGQLTHSLRSVALLVAVAAITVGVVAHTVGRTSWLAGRDDTRSGRDV